MLLSVSMKCRSMFLLLLLLNLLLCHAKNKLPEEVSDEDFGTNLVAIMRNDANLDLSADEEYEDLRAELLAYHTALASISSGRRSLISTPCWTLGGICVDHTLCTGFRYLTEVPGCKNKLMVCCFAWNKYKLKDWRDKGLGSPVMPWSKQLEFGGQGVIVKDKDNLPKKKKIKNKKKISYTIINKEVNDEEGDNNKKDGDAIIDIVELKNVNKNNPEMDNVEHADEKNTM